MTNPLLLLSQAEVCFQKENFRKAERLLKSAFRRTKDRFLRAEIAAKRAESLRLLGRFQEALRLYWESHKLYRLCGVNSERLRTLLGASGCLRVLGRFAQARRMWRTVRKLRFFGVAEPRPEEVLMEMALVERGSGNLAVARRMLLECLRRFRGEKGDEVTQAWWALGGTERFSGRLRHSLRAFHRAAVLAKRSQDRSSEAYALCGQAGALRVLGRGQDSYRKYRQAFDLFKGIEDPFGKAYTMCGMANALRVYGDARRTLPLYRKAQRLYERLGDNGSAAFCLWGLGGSLRRMGRLASALSEYREALRTFHRVGDHRGETMALLGIARVVGKLGSPQKAEAFAVRARRLAQSRKLPFEAALARLEQKKSSPSSLSPFGISPAAVQSWKDLP